MRVLIVVYSFTGNNRLLARRLAERLGAEVVEVHEPRQRTMVTILLDLAFAAPCSAAIQILAHGNSRPAAPP